MGGVFRRSTEDLRWVVGPRVAGQPMNPEDDFIGVVALAVALASPLWRWWPWPWCPKHGGGTSPPGDVLQSGHHHGLGVLVVLNVTIEPRGGHVLTVATSLWPCGRFVVSPWWPSSCVLVDILWCPHGGHVFVSLWTLNGLLWWPCPGVPMVAKFLYLYGHFMVSPCPCGGQVLMSP